MKSQQPSALARRYFGSYGAWKGHQRANVHFLYFEKGMHPHDIAFLIGLPLAKILPSVRRTAYRIRIKAKPYKLPGW